MSRLAGGMARLRRREALLVGVGVPLRPGREASIARRLLARHAGPFPALGVVRIWREVICACTSLQRPLLIAVCDALRHRCPVGYLRLERQFRPHPLRKRVLAVGDRSREEHREKDPAEQQAGPGVQVRHALSDASPGQAGLIVQRLGLHPHHSHHATATSGAATTTKPSHARVALRTANTQITAPA